MSRLRDPAAPLFVSYLRVSTDRQGRSGLGLEAQREAVARYLVGLAGRRHPPRRKIDYILGGRERSSNEVRETVLHDHGATVPLTIPRQKCETDLAVKEVRIEGRRYIACRNAEEARTDPETRARVRAGLRKHGRSQGFGRQQRLPPLPGRARGRRIRHRPGDGRGEAQFDGIFVC